MNFFSKLKNTFNEIDKNLQKNKININNDDSLIEKGFFALLQDLLNDIFNNKNNVKTSNLLNELKKNEKLSKAKLIKSLVNSLEQNQNLSQKDKETIGKNLSNKYVQDLTFNLVTNKLDEQNSTELTTKDVVKAGINTTKKSDSVASTTTKKIVKKILTKQ